MSNEPISNPGVTPVPGAPQYGEDHPRLGEGEEAQPTKPFTLGPEGGPAETEAKPAEQPSPMELARDTAQRGAREELSPEELQDQLKNLQTRFEGVQTQLQDPNVTNKFTPDHHEALNRLVERTNPDLRTIANNSDAEFNPPQHQPGESVIGYVLRWFSGSQETLGKALDYVSGDTKPTPEAFLKLQYSVQRAVQRGELFASVVGATASGIKTIMSTQLG
ncbi:MAG: hypothetical protein WAM28_00235 [Chlamydiales bacterium]